RGLLIFRRKHVQPPVRRLAPDHLVSRSFACQGRPIRTPCWHEAAPRDIPARNVDLTREGRDEITRSRPVLAGTAGPPRGAAEFRWKCSLAPMFRTTRTRALPLIMRS